jgi:isocitrate dehydrogenase
VGGPRGRRERVQAGPALGRAAGHDRLDQEDQDRAQGPLETPIGFGEKSANVTLAKLFETYANIRPVRTLPGVPTPFAEQGIDLVVVRENVEDLYAGIEYMQTPGVAEALKLISRKGCEKIVRLASSSRVRGPHEGALRDQVEHHEDDRGHAQAHVRGGRAGVSRDRVAAHHRRQLRAPAGAFPEWFEVIIMTNMNGDILSDLTSG